MWDQRLSYVRRVSGRCNCLGCWQIELTDARQVAVAGGDGGSWRPLENKMTHSLWASPPGFRDERGRDPPRATVNRAAVRKLRDDAEIRREAENESDAELLSRVGQGELSPLGVLYDRYHDSVRQFVGWAIGGDVHADDLTHEAFLALARIAGRYDGRESARPLLIGIASKLVQEHRRGRARWSEVVQSFASATAERTVPTPENTASVTEEMRRFDEALARLSEEKRLVVLMVEGEGLSGEEVARALEIPIGTVWTRLHYAREELRRAMEAKPRRTRVR
jgi:RNA polymerase sigma factor (sigma-70 family)